MRILLAVLFLILCLPYNSSQQKISLGQIIVFANEAQKSPYSAYSIVDVPGNYKNYYQAYKNNTKKLEDSHYSRKITILQGKKKSIYQLIFKHWFIGELFRLQEEHIKMAQAKWWVIEKNYAYQGKQQAPLYQVTKKLLVKTKSSWVGDRFNYLKITIAFIALTPKHTRIYYKIKIDAQDKRSVKAAKQEAYDGIAAILRCQGYLK